MRMPSLLVACLLIAGCQAETREQARDAGRSILEDAKKAADNAPGARRIGNELKRAGRKAKKVIEREAKVMEDAVKINGKTLREDIKDFGREDKPRASKK